MKDEVLAAQARFDRAELDGDATTLEELLTDDFASIGPKGFVLDRRRWIDRHQLFRYETLDVSDVEVACYEQAAIVRNLQHNRATYEGEPVELTVRVSQTWVRQGEQWRLAGIQFSPVPSGASA
jgi:ketosteroid isomerase-like protein